MTQAYDNVAGRFFQLPEGWAQKGDRREDIVRDDGRARVILTGPNGRYVAQQRVGSHWVSLCRPGARGNSYFPTALGAIAHADRYAGRE